MGGNPWPRPSPARVSRAREGEAAGPAVDILDMTNLLSFRAMPVEATYHRLMGSGAGDAFDRHVFACAIALAASELDRPLTAALGLPATALRALFATYFPGEAALLAGVPEDAGCDALEEPDLRSLLLEIGRAHV